MSRLHVLQAPSEAEAQCAQMCKEGLVRPDFCSAPSARAGVIAML